ncbi:hypothetical protein BGZ97_001220 [Linnemannia gamsii]|uniref:Uncharacterized protein n=1 Tax=Linnemannia gamsii TaxID=64522 RepID=A0A9P6QYU5_9FUNG|nr:hypothetical protein BGZ97_001220 [Linnemannia gamsii]
MLGSAAQFGKPYVAQRDQERSAKDPSTDFGIPGMNRDRAISGNTVSSSNDGILSASGASSASISKGTSTVTNNTRQDVKRAQKKLSGSSGSRGKGDFTSMTTRNETSKKG